MEEARINYGRRLRWMAAIKGIVLIVLGVVALLRPEVALLSFAIYVGAAILVMGIVIIISAIANRKMQGWGWALAEGIVDLIFGVVLISYPFVTILILPVMVGFWIFFSGILQLTTSIAYRKELKNWWIGVLYGIIAMLFFFFILYSPVLTSLIFVVTVGIFAIVFGIYYIFTAITHKRIAY